MSEHIGEMTYSRCTSELRGVWPYRRPDPHHWRRNGSRVTLCRDPFACWSRESTRVTPPEEGAR